MDADADAEMKITPPSLYGFYGRALGCPSLPYAVALSFAGPLLVVALAVSFLPGFLVGRSGPMWARLAAAGWCLLSIMAITLAPTLLQTWRIRHIYPRFSIMALRPFHNQAASSLYRTLVAPVLGCYGVVRVVSDESLAKSEPKLDGRKLDFRLMGDPRMAMTYSGAEWQKKVIVNIASSDLAVIDLSIPSVNLLWETAICIQFLPPHRIFFVGVKGVEWNEVVDLVHKFHSEFLPQGTPHLDVQQPINYGGRLFPQWRFRVGIFRAMRAIRRLDESVAASGAWAVDLPVKPTVG